MVAEVTINNNSLLLSSLVAVGITASGFTEPTDDKKQKQKTAIAQQSVKASISWLTLLSELGAMVSVIQEPNRDPEARIVIGLLTPVSLPQPENKKKKLVEWFCVEIYRRSLAIYFSEHHLLLNNGVLMTTTDFSWFILNVKVASRISVKPHKLINVFNPEIYFHLFET